MKVDTSNLEGKNAFVTGATGGIGSQIAIQLAKEGCNLFLTGRNEQTLKSISKQCESFGVKVTSSTFDFSKSEQIYDAIKCARKSYSGFHILINSCGIFCDKNLFESNDKILNDLFMINFKTAVILSRELGKFMCESNWGRIVNIGSSSSYYGFSNTGLYCASKHALLGFSRSIHNEFKSKNVRSYCISPSSTKSKMGRLTKDQDYDSFIEPYDVAQYVVFCISFNGNAVTDEVFLKRMEIC